MLYFNYFWSRGFRLSSQSSKYELRWNHHWSLFIVFFHWSTTT